MMRRSIESSRKRQIIFIAVMVSLPYFPAGSAGHVLASTGHCACRFHFPLEPRFRSPLTSRARDGCVPHPERRTAQRGSWTRSATRTGPGTCPRMGRSPDRLHGRPLPRSRDAAARPIRSPGRRDARSRRRRSARVGGAQQPPGWEPNAGPATKVPGRSFSGRRGAAPHGRRPPPGGARRRRRRTPPRRGSSAAGRRAGSARGRAIGR